MIIYIYIYFYLRLYPDNYNFVIYITAGVKHRVHTFIQSVGVKNIEEHLLLHQVCVYYVSNIFF